VKLFQGMRQFKPAPADPGMVLTAYFECDVLGHLLAGFFEFAFLGKNQPGHNQGLRPGTAFDQPPVNQKLI
jgi:hypothetical protein